MHMSIIKCCNNPDMTRLRTLCSEGDDVPHSSPFSMNPGPQCWIGCL